MSDAGYVIGGYVLVLGSITAYIARVLFRGRSLSKQVEVEKRRWM